jgi:transposase-like protein
MIAPRSSDGADREQSSDPGRAPRKTGIVPVEARAAEEPKPSVDSWDEEQKAAIVAQIAQAQSTVEMASERYGLSIDEVQDWLRAFRRSAMLAFDAKLTETLVGQGADPSVLGAAEFTGRLDEVSVIDLLQSIHMARQSAVIVITHDGLESRVWCAGGTVIDAVSGRLQAEAALHRIVSFDHGRVVADFRSVPRSRTIQTPTSRLLLEAAHRKDESVRLWRRLGAATPPYRATELATTGLARLSPAEQALLATFDEPRSLLDVLRGSDLGDVETLTALARLADIGFIERDASAAAVPSSAVSATAVASASQRGGAPIDAPSFLISMSPRTSRRAATQPGRATRWVWAAFGVAALALPVLWGSTSARKREAAPVAPPVASVMASPVLPTPVVSLDTPPPSERPLQPMPLSVVPSPEPAACAAPAAAVQDARRTARTARERRAPRRARNKSPAPRRQLAPEPRVQGIDADIPQIEVIE